MNRFIALFLSLLVLSSAWSSRAQQLLSEDIHVWSASEKKLLSSLSLTNLPSLAADPSNAVADNKLAAELGRQLFFDSRLSANEKFSCASCHKPALAFTDGLALAAAIGTTRRHSMTLVGAAYNPWYFWDGRKDSQWSQALEPIENAVELGSNRNKIAHLLHNDPQYRRYYEQVFGMFPDISDTVRFPLSAGPVENPRWRSAWDQMSNADQQIINRIFSNTGKVISAYERLLKPQRSRFDDYVDAVVADDRETMKNGYSDSETRGLRLFIGKAQCVNCHNGPLLTNYSFHNTGVLPFQNTHTATGDNPMIEDAGRLEGVAKAKADPFNCLGEYSDAGPEHCPHIRFMRNSGNGLYRAFKTPSLRNIAQTAPYMHTGQMTTLSAVLTYYNRPLTVGEQLPEILPLKLKESELHDLEAYLNTLSDRHFSGETAYGPGKNIN